MPAPSRPLLCWVSVALSLAALSGCAGGSASVKQSAPHYPEAENLSHWPDEYPLPPDQDIGIAELGRTETSSVHIVQIRHRESLHTHERHDLVAVLLRGYGTFRLGPRTFAVKQGSIVAVPRGMPHAFVNKSREVAAAFVVFTPPFDGTDTVPAADSP